MGEGMGLGLPFIDVANGRAVVKGGVYEIGSDGGTEIGLKRFPGEGIRFEHVPGSVLAPREGVAERAYEWRLTDLTDGSLQYFDGQGNAVAFSDRHGNRIDFEFVAAGEKEWQLAKVIDAYGASIDLTYETGESGQERVIFQAPERVGDRHRLRTVLDLTDGQVRKITATDGGETNISYERPLSGHGAVVSRVVTPLGGVTEISYEELQGSPVPALTASRVRVLDSNGDLAAPEQRFKASLDGGRNYMGAGGDFAGENDVFDQRTGYTYSTEVASLDSEGNPERRIVSEYNSLHLMISQQVFTSALGDQEAGKLQNSYSWQQSAGSPLPPGRGEPLPGDWARPIRTTNAAYNSAGNSREVITAATYDSLGRVVRRVDEEGAVTEFLYDSDPKSTGLILAQKSTGKDGKVLQETVNILSGDRRTISRSVLKKADDSGGDLKEYQETSFKYDEHGQVAEEKLAWGSDVPAEARRGPGSVVTRYSRTVNGGELSETTTTGVGTAAESATVRKIDLASGNEIAVVDADQFQTTTEYDTLGRPTRRWTNRGTSAEQLTETEYVSANETKVRTPDGRVTVTVVDALGRKTRTTDNVQEGRVLPSGQQVRTLESVDYRQWRDREVKVTDALGRSTITRTDLQGRETQKTLPSGITGFNQYDDVENSTIKDTAPAGKGIEASAATTTLVFDSLQREKASRSEYSDGSPASPASIEYDGIGRITSRRVNDLAVSVAERNAGASKVETSLPLSSEFAGPETSVTNSYGLAEVSALQSVSADQGNGVEETRDGAEAVYDEQGRIREERIQSGLIISYAYTPGGRVTRKEVRKDGEGSPIAVETFAYDKDSGLLDQRELRRNGVSKVTEYRYDTVTGNLLEVWDQSDPAGTKIAYEYDADGRRTSVLYPDGIKLSRVYNSAGQVAASFDSQGYKTSYSYRSDGSLEWASLASDPSAGGSSDAVEIARESYTYDTLGNLSKVERKNGTVTDYTYWDSGRVKTEKTRNADGEVVSYAYSYDGHGNVKLRTESRPDAATGSEEVSTTRYTYDAYDRLLKSEVFAGDGTDGAPARSVEYGFNASGDIVNEKDTRSESGDTSVRQRTSVIDDAGRLTAVINEGNSVEQEWDAEGNLLKDAAGNRYSYGPANEVISVTSAKGSTTRYDYWADGNRRSVRYEGEGKSGTTRFYFDPVGAQTKEQFTLGDGESESGAFYLMAAGRRSARIVAPIGGMPESTEYLHSDRHGSVVATTDEGGAVKDAYWYSDYGTRIDSSGRELSPTGNMTENPYLFGGEYTNFETGTQYLRSRIYDPRQRRFLTRDSESYHNRYQAFDANPVVKVDPTGKYAAYDEVENSDNPYDPYDVIMGSTLMGLGGVLSAAFFVASVFAVATLGFSLLAVAAVVSSSTAFIADLVSIGTGAAVLADANEKNKGNEGFLDEETRKSLTIASDTASIVSMVAGVANAATSVPKVGTEMVEGAMKKGSLASAKSLISSESKAARGAQAGARIAGAAVTPSALPERQGKENGRMGTREN
ncbi:RHS repeat domain-containing protein [Streptomyces sp. NRRL F-2664]|uniref:RHS repeat domain-containing protein n=1 Tax=Streptomyces sp. NRRL F-2664 TaxID=1463842 RepID=UPI00131CF598|nr:RHS repeat-associated core domain-containing protein [Streptomyces sp. NRRL F-2664]